jgi:uncharacterized protein VirK/YbjX
MGTGLLRIAARLPLRERLRYLARLWLNWPWVWPLLQQLRRSPFATLLLHDPAILNRARRPYLAASWPRHRRLAVVGSHYRFLARQPGLAGAVYCGDGLLLARLDSGEGAHELLLHYTPRFGHEGEMTLSLGHPGEARKLASLSFTIDATCTLHPCMRIGCIQSDGGDDTLDLIRGFTREHHGMRPKPLLIWAARQLAARLRLHRVCGIRDDHHVYRHPHYRHSQGARMHSRYDELWQEAGGAARGEWYELACGEDRRDTASIPSRKRALYARRYAWLDNLATQMDCAITGPRRSQPPRAPVPLPVITVAA